MYFLTSIRLISSIKNGLLLGNLLIQLAMLINEKKRNDAQSTFRKIQTVFYLSVISWRLILERKS